MLCQSPYNHVDIITLEIEPFVAKILNTQINEFNEIEYQ